MSYDETYPCYVKIGIEGDDPVELPTDKDGTMLLNTVASQFPGAVGLRFKSDAGSWRGVRLDDNNILDVPIEGWGDNVYFVIMPDGAMPSKKRTKRKMVVGDDDDDDDDDDDSPLQKMNKMTDAEILAHDLIVLKIPYKAVEANVKAHFEQYGEVEKFQIKYDEHKVSRGFGFVRFKTVDAVSECFKATHIIDGREIQVRFPKDRRSEDWNPTKLFVGRLPKDIMVDELRAYFKKFGALSETKIPTPFKGYGFVTFKREIDARTVVETSHVIKGQYVNVNFPTSKRPGAPDYEWHPHGYRNPPGFGNEGLQRWMQGRLPRMPRPMSSSRGLLPTPYSGNYGYGNYSPYW